MSQAVEIYRHHLSKYEPKFCKTVVSMMKEGASKTEVAAALGVTPNTMEKWAKDKGDFGEALGLGLLLSEAWWEMQGRINLENRSFNAVLWYMNMKNRFGWRDKHEIDSNMDVKIFTCSREDD